jgi:hypothetical protein
VNQGGADRPGPAAVARLRGREENSWIWIGELRLDLLWLNLNRPISDGCQRSNGWRPDAGVVAPRVDGSGLQLRKKHSGERGPGKPGMEKANRRVSRVADGEAELTEARGGARARRRSQDGQRSSVSGGGASWLRAQSERGARGFG